MSKYIVVRNGRAVDSRTELPDAIDAGRSVLLPFKIYRLCADYQSWGQHDRHAVMKLLVDANTTPTVRAIAHTLLDLDPVEAANTLDTLAAAFAERAEAVLMERHRA